VRTQGEHFEDRRPARLRAAPVHLAATAGALNNLINILGYYEEEPIRMLK
jgi:hypothetical protein